MKTSYSIGDNGRRPSEVNRPDHDEIAAVAYQFYLENGRQEGRDREDWFRAEALLISKSANQGASQLGISNPDFGEEEPRTTAPVDSREYAFAGGVTPSPTRKQVHPEVSPQILTSRPPVRRPERST